MAGRRDSNWPSTKSYQVFVSDPVPFSDTEKAPNGDRQLFLPISCTLIFGDTDAVLVDPPMTIDQTERVGNWVQASGKRLAHIVITHGHGDHWFGTAPLLRRFPGASAFAAPGTIEVMRFHASPEVRARDELPTAISDRCSCIDCRRTARRSSGRAMSDNLFGQKASVPHVAA